MYSHLADKECFDRSDERSAVGRFSGVIPLTQLWHKKLVLFPILFSSFSTNSESLLDGKLGCILVCLSDYHILYITLFQFTEEL